jgi:hypothetical protein
MTSEELAAAGILPAEEEVQETKNAQLPEDNPIFAAAPKYEIHEEGEIRSEGEDLENVNADPRDLIAAKCSKSLPPSFVFSEFQVTTNLIKEYEAPGFFPVGHGCAPLDEQIPTPEADEVVMFRDFFTCGLSFPR